MLRTGVRHGALGRSAPLRAQPMLAKTLARPGTAVARAQGFLTPDEDAGEVRRFSVQPARSAPQTLEQRVKPLMPRWKRSPLSDETTAAIIETVLLDGERRHATANHEERAAVRRETEGRVYQMLDDAKKPVSALRELAATILQQSKAPETMQVVGRLYALAYRRGDADAGYSWATMVLEGLLASSSPNKVQAAVDVYANLARNGHANSQFGLGRVLLSQAVRSPEHCTALVQRCTELWDSAGRNGMGDAYYELGRLYESGEMLKRDPERAVTYFEHGARMGSVLAAYALGVVHSERASKASTSDAAQAAAQLATRYFLQAARSGHAPSAYNMGIRYLERPNTGEQAFTPEEHQQQFGVVADDRSAREWLSAAASKTMMNLGTMLVEGRGRPAEDKTPTLEELEQAKALYEKVLLHTARLQRRREQAVLPASGDATPEVLQHMTGMAKRMLERVETLLARTAAAGPTDALPRSNGPSCTVM